jgi:hypothetical protein
LPRLELLQEFVELAGVFGGLAGSLFALRGGGGRRFFRRRFFGRRLFGSSCLPGIVGIAEGLRLIEVFRHGQVGRGALSGVSLAGRLRGGTPLCFLLRIRSGRGGRFLRFRSGGGRLLGGVLGTGFAPTDVLGQLIGQGLAQRFGVFPVEAQEQFHLRHQKGPQTGHGFVAPLLELVDLAAQHLAVLARLALDLVGARLGLLHHQGRFFLSIFDLLLGVLAGRPEGFLEGFLDLLVMLELVLEGAHLLFETALFVQELFPLLRDHLQKRLDVVCAVPAQRGVELLLADVHGREFHGRSGVREIRC